MATLSTPVGQTSLGNYIFTGLQTLNWILVLFGCVAAAVLALIVDRLLATAEAALERALRKHGPMSAAAERSRGSKKAVVVPERERFAVRCGAMVA